jgi:hypothetical protein
LYYWACKCTVVAGAWGGGGRKGGKEGGGARFKGFLCCKSTVDGSLSPPPSPVPTRDAEVVDTALINAHVLFNELRDGSPVSTQDFRAAVVDGLLHVAEVRIPTLIPFGKAAARDVCSIAGAKGIIPVATLQHVLVVESDANRRGDCAVCGRKSSVKCQTCAGPHKKGLWFCIAADRNCWAMVHTM